MESLFFKTGTKKKNSHFQTQPKVLKLKKKGSLCRYLLPTMYATTGPVAIYWEKMLAFSLMYHLIASGSFRVKY
jgi:hypothetical protein